MYHWDVYETISFNDDVFKKLLSRITGGTRLNHDGFPREVECPLTDNGQHSPGVDLLTEWMHLYGTDVLNVAYSYVRHYQQAQDITQEVFIRAFRKMDSFRHDSSVRTWLLSITVNCCKDFLRSWQYRKVRPEERLEVFTEQESSVMDSPELLTLQSLERSDLWQAVGELPVKYREVLVLFYLRELSGQEIANVLNTSEQNVRTRLHRARLLLKDVLERRGWNSGQGE